MASRPRKQLRQEKDKEYLPGDNEDDMTDEYDEQYMEEEEEEEEEEEKEGTGSKTNTPFSTGEKWGKDIRPWLASGVSAEKKNAVQKKYEVFRNHMNGTQLAVSKEDMHLISALQRYMMQKPSKSSKEQWASNKLIQLAVLSRKKKVAARKSSETPSSESASSVIPMIDLASTGVDTVNTVKSKPTASSSHKKNIKFSVEPKSGMICTSTFRINQDSPVKKKSRIVSEPEQVTDAFEYDTDTFVSVYKKTFGTGNRATDKFYLRDTRKYWSKTVKDDQHYTFDYPISVDQVRTIQKMKALAQFDELYPGLREEENLTDQDNEIEKNGQSQDME